MNYDNTNRGVLFNNSDRKRDGKRDPDYTGKLDVGGTEYFLDAWINASKDGKKYMSLKVKAKGPKPEHDERVRKYASNADQRRVEVDDEAEFDDSVPF